MGINLDNVMQIGSIQPAGLKHGPYSDEYFASVSKHFSVDCNKIRRELRHLEEGEKPEIVLLQNPNKADDVQAVCFVSSVWSRSHKLLRRPHEQINRDFHYQCFFTAMEMLSEIGCTELRVENLKSGYKWQCDDYACMTEAWKNIIKLINPNAKVQLREDSIERKIINEIASNMHLIKFDEHRPIKVSPFVRDGLNIYRIFVESPSNHHSYFDFDIDGVG